MSSVLYSAFCDLVAADDECDEDARRDEIDERRRRARLNHWCPECHGMRGGPCVFGDEEPEPETEPETDDSEEETP